MKKLEFNSDQKPKVAFYMSKSQDNPWTYLKEKEFDSDQKAKIA